MTLTSPGDTPPLGAAPAQLSAGWNQGLRFLSAALEVVLVLLVCLAAWPIENLGITPSILLYAGLALLLLLWAARIVVVGSFTWQKGPLTLCLALLFLSVAWQLIPLPKGMMEFVAPATSEVYDQLLPLQAEVVPGNPRAVPAVPRTLTLNQQATRDRLLDQLAFLLIFVLATHEIACPAALYRLCVAMLVNTTALSLFGLFLDGPTGGYLRREEVGLYLDIGLGLGLGLFIFRAGSPGPAGWSSAIIPLLTASMAIILGGIALTFSWAGLAGVAAGALFCWMLLGARAPNRILIYGACAAAVIFGGWLCRDAIQAELSRATSILAFCERFPLWGTGYGTFSQVAVNQGFTDGRTSMATLSSPGALLVITEEGGLVGLAFTLATIGCIFFTGWQALGRHRTAASAGLVLGALFGFASLVIDGCMRSASCATAPLLLLTLLGAHLFQLARPARAADSNRQTYSGLRISGWAVSSGAIVLLLLAVVLLNHGWRLAVEHDYSLKAKALDLADNNDNWRNYLQALQAAVKRSPRNAYLHLELAKTHLGRFQRKLLRLQEISDFTTTALIINSVARGGFVEAGSFAFYGPLAACFSMNWQEFSAAKGTAVLEKQHLIPALRSLAEARNLCLLNPEPHWQIAGLHSRFLKADEPDAYRQRAKWVAPNDARVWYQCGLQELEAGFDGAAWQSWRQSLRLSDGYLAAILNRCRDLLSVEELADSLLAERPEQLVEAAAWLYPDPSAAKDERLFLWKKAVSLIEGNTSASAGDYHLAATIYDAMESFDQGRQAYQRALALEPGRTSWRYEFAGFLYKNGRYPEAEAELITLLTQTPKDEQALLLLTKTKKRMSR